MDVFVKLHVESFGNIQEANMVIISIFILLAYLVSNLENKQS